MKHSTHIGAPDLSEALDKAVGPGRGSHLEIDLDHYQSYLDDPSLSPDQREQVIGALWTIVTAFVELGFGVHPVQQACGKPQTALDRSANSESTKHKQDRKNPDTDAPAI